MSPLRITPSTTRVAAFHGTPLSSLLLASAMVLLAITLRHATTGPDRFVLVMAVMLALVHAVIGCRRWQATQARRTR